MTENHVDEHDLHAYLDGELTPADRRRITSHLERCPDCREQLDALDRLFSRVEAAPELPLERDLAPGVLGRLPRPQPVPRWLPAAGLLQAAAAAAILAAVLPDLLADPAVASVTTGLLAPVEDALANPEQWALVLTGPISAAEAALQETLAALAHPDLILGGLATLLPLAAASTLLWLVGNGVVIRRHTRT